MPRNLLVCLISRNGFQFIVHVIVRFNAKKFGWRKRAVGCAATDWRRQCQPHTSILVEHENVVNGFTIMSCYTNGNLAERERAVIVLHNFCIILSDLHTAVMFNVLRRRTHAADCVRNKKMCPNSIENSDSTNWIRQIQPTVSDKQINRANWLLSNTNETDTISVSLLQKETRSSSYFSLETQITIDYADIFHLINFISKCNE